MAFSNSLITPPLFLFLYILTQSQACTPSVDFCLSCLDSVTCGDCNIGYGKYFSSPQTLCQACQDLNCFDCSASNSCDQCKYGFRSKSSGGVNICQKCTDRNCQYCPSAPNDCSLCYLSNRVKPDGKCQPCTDRDCLICDVNKDQCTECCCKKGVNLNTNKCDPCRDKKCLQCPLNYLICQLCDIGFGVSNGNCLPCSTNCLQCPTNVNNCIKCVVDYGVSGGVCQTCLSKNCLTCNQTDISICFSCVVGFGLNINDNCVACLTTNCQQCPTNYTQCIECKIGFGLLNGIITNPCQPCPIQCLACSTTNNVNCTSCIVGYFVLSSSNTCQLCTNFISVRCLQCMNQTFCTLCEDGYYADPTGGCTLCPSPCTLCFNNLIYNSIQCTACEPTYALLLTTPPICGEPCGDYVAIVAPCDYQIGIQYDGCNNTCGVQDGFQCRKANYTATCSYENKIEMEIVGFEKEKFENKFSITVRIWPPLYVFKTSDLKGVFFIKDPTFSIQSITFDALTNLMVFKVRFQADYIDRDLLIQFIPDQNVDQRYYASVNSNALKRVNLIYYPQWVLQSSKFSYYFLYFIMVTGNIGALIGLIGKRLAGLEAMFVYQFAYLSIVWVNSQLYLPFTVISPLKYTNGYHKQGLIQNGNRSILDSQYWNTNPSMYPYPHTEQFSFDEDRMFINNFNLFFILQIIFLLMYFVTSVILYFLKRKNVQLLKANNNNQSQEQRRLKNHINRTVTAREFSASSFMYVGLINLIYFLACTYLFFNSNQYDIINIVFFAIVALIYAATYVLFCCDPDPFDYFRYSFLKARIAMLYYYVYPFIVALSAFLLIKFKPTWPPILPMLIYLPFILIYRPYKQFLENFRSAFNLLVIIMWFCLRLFLQNNSQKRNDAFALNFVNILLLLVVMVLSYVSLIYHIVNSCLKQKQAENTEEQVMMQLQMMNVRERMQYAKNEDMIFKKLLEPRMNIIQFSNNLRPNGNNFVHQYSSVKKQVESQRMFKPETPEIIQEKKKVIDHLKQKMQTKQVQFSKQELNENAKLIYAMEILDKQNKFIRLKNAKDFTMQLMKQQNDGQHENYINNYNKI